MAKLRAGEPFPVGEKPRRRFVIGRKKAHIRLSAGALKKKRMGCGSSEPAMPPRQESRARPESAVSAPGIVALEDTDALDCGVCFLPLKPPIFQCNRGHVVCSQCHDKLKATGKCHVCGVAMCGYSRCHAMERLVESIRVQCLNAAHGCTARPTYYDRHCHCQTCPYTPWQCPGEACGFVGSMDSLLHHLAGLHSWSCPIAAMDDEAFSVCLHDGFNFLLADVINGDDDGSLLTSQCLILMKVARPAYGCTISVLRMLPDAAATASNLEPSLKELQCEIQYSHRGSGKLKEHDQKSKFIVECASLSNGLPNLDESFQFLVAKSVLADDDTIQVQGRMVAI